ncbi:MAG: 5-(carboxyamino)imidazole ribonucleotide mutase [Ignavibacteriales bacterium]|nr:5-(carboxyamino)imidazole ribonucleotide mutase [Ignavibacteriales bacterium]
MANTVQVGIIMGSDSDLSIMKEASEILNEFGIKSEMKIISAHRSPNVLAEYASTAIDRGLKVIIAGAGAAAHLPGVTAAFTTIPIIGVPIKSKSLDGLDSLLSIVQMPSGVPVATVAINGAKNAGILAAQIIGVSDKSIQQKLVEYKLKLAEESIKKNEKI